MRKVAMSKFSLVGLALMAASTVTAAFAPAKSDNKKINNNNNGTLRPNSNTIGGPAVLSCFNDQDIFDSCTASFFSATTTPNDEADSRITVGFGQWQTSRNTSNTLAIPDGPFGTDQTSHVVSV